MTIEGLGVCLRPTQFSDFEEWAELRRTSRSFIAPWEPSWSEDELSLTGFRQRLARQADEIAHDRAYTLLMVRASDSRMFGQLTFGQVKRGAAQSAILGGWVGKQYSGRGLAPRAVRLGLSFAFGALRLNRIEAATLPDNRNSNHLLEHVGFKVEGLGRAYGKIDGIWRDHILWSLIAGDPVGKSDARAHSLHPG